ncbi:hypothetical protein H0H87_012185 [Tephrocybe sp. NHM501043]|nr:hypothetical protein H0H87_012185 [Tephrocybe sp. NHM501043]
MKLLYSLLCAAIVVASVQAKVTHEDLAKNKEKGLRLLHLENGADPIWKTEDEKLELKRKDVNFMDVTEVWNPDAPIPKLEKNTNLAVYPPPSHQTQVRELIGKINVENIKKTVHALADFHDRYITTQGGVDAANWMTQAVQAVISFLLYGIHFPLTGLQVIDANPGTRATVRKFEHSWPQHSIIARIPGTTDGPVSIVSAHTDTINLDYGRFWEEAPGADDDASACGELLEVFRIFVESNFQPTTPIEFQWVSGEEPGSLGSQEVATDYKKRGVQVKGMMNIVLAG